MRIEISDSTFLRPLEEADERELHRLIDANRAYLATWLPWAADQTIDDTRHFICRAREQLASENGFQAAIVLGADIVGVVGFHSIDRAHRSTRIGYWLDEGHQGRGTMTLAVKALVEHAFDVWDLNRVEILVENENRSSRAIPERLGFRGEGMRQTEDVGERFVYAMLATDWR